LRVAEHMWWRQLNRSPFGYLIWLAIGSVLPLIVQDPYFRYLMVLTIIFAILSLSLDVIVGLMGQFSFGHQAFFGISAYTTAVLTTKLALPVWLGFGAGIFVAGLLGLIVGLIALRRTRGLYLAIITLGFGQIVWLVASNWFDLTGGLSGIALIPSPRIGGINLNTEFEYYYFALVMLVLTAYTVELFRRSKTGRAVSAVSENEELARSVGINPFKVYVVAFTLATTLAGLAGVTYAHFTTHVAPNSLSLYYMFWMLVMVIVGGRGTILGPIVGAFIFVFVLEWLDFAQEWKLVIFGFILLLSVLFLPAGIVPSLKTFTRRAFDGVVEWRRSRL